MIKNNDQDINIFINIRESESMLLSYVKFVNIISNESNQPFICNLAIIDNGYTFLMIHLYDLVAAKI